MDVSVVIPVYNGAATLEATLRALSEQTLQRDRYEIVVVDDGSRDSSGEIAHAYADRTIAQCNAGAPSARNAGIRAASGAWIAFTDADCVPSRGWLAALLSAAQKKANSIGAAGKTLGLESKTPAAQFVDLMGGLDAQRYLAHPRFPFAPTGNALYRRQYLLEVGGFDERYATFDACDLHTRLLRQYPGQPFTYEPRALVLHRHRAGWRAYWQQQFFYGVGYAQFMLAHRDDVRWTRQHQLRATSDVAAKALAALLPSRGTQRIVRHGQFVRAAAQQAGFISTFYSATERRRW